jgi:hypothetical protein
MKQRQGQRQRLRRDRDRDRDRDRYRAVGGWFANMMPTGGDAGAWTALTSTCRAIFRLWQATGVQALPYACHDVRHTMCRIAAGGMMRQQDKA